jgi:hypothetical protein
MAKKQPLKYIEVEGRKVPRPNYDHDIDRLVKEYKKAMKKLYSLLMRTDVHNLQRANALALIKEIEKELKLLDLFAADWIAENIPIAAEHGVASSLVTLGLVETIEEARAVVKFNKINAAAIEAAIADTQEDLLQMTQNVKKRVRNAIRQVTADVMRENMTRGVNGIRTNSRDITRGLYEKLGKSLDTGIVDARNYKWKPTHYVDTVVRTKMLDIYRETHTNEALSRGAQYAVISSHGAKDACRFHEGRIVKLDPNAEGSYPTIDELRGSNQIFHPRCKHTYAAIRNLDRLTPSLKENAEKQEKRGNAALAAGTRNPKDIE